MAVRKNAPVQGEQDDNKEELWSEFQKVIDSVNKEYNPGTATLLGSHSKLDVETTSTGSLVVDSILGGGLPKGRIIEIYGPEASGKTSIALTSIANTQKEGGTAVFVDAEHALDPRYARTLGVDTKRLCVVQPDNAEQAIDIMNTFIKSGAVSIIVLDSVAALVPKAELEGEIDKQTMALTARLMSKALRVLTSKISNTKCICIFINQIRDNIGGYGPMTVTSGGKALKFYASQRIEIRRQTKPVTDEKGNNIGTLVKVKCTKNKIAPPFGEGETILTYNKGINQEAELLVLAQRYGILNAAGGSYKDAETGESIGPRGQAKLIAYLADRSNGVFDKYYALTKKKMDALSAAELDEDPDEDEDDAKPAVAADDEGFEAEANVDE